MATSVYANLLGNWVNLSDDKTATIDDGKNPNIWWEENAPLWAPIHRETKDTLYQFPYVMVSYHGKDYRLTPDKITIVEE